MSEPVVESIAVVEDRTASSKCDEGFLRLRRLILQNTYTDGRVSDPYPCDIVSRRRVDAVAVVLYHRERTEGGERLLVHYREGTRAPLWLRRTKQEELPLPDPRPYERIGEIVAGVLEEDDLGWEGIRKRGALEALEEAGYEVDPARVRPLGPEGFFPSPGVTDEKVFLVAVEIDPTRRKQAEGDGSVMEEGTRTLTLPLGEAIAACRSGAIPDAKTEIAFLRLADHLGYVAQLDLFAADLPAELRARFDSLGTPPAE